MNASKKIRILAALGMLSGAVWAGTFAAFTDSGTATSTFSAGTVDLSVQDDADDAYGFTTLSMANMKPGDTKYASLKISNIGTLDFDYTMATTDTGEALADKLDAGIRVVATATCDSTTYAAAALTGILYAEGPLSAAAIGTRTVAATADPATATDEFLCFKVAFPAEADDNNFQGASTQATFTFNATQNQPVL